MWVTLIGNSLTNFWDVLRIDIMLEAEWRRTNLVLGPSHSCNKFNGVSTKVRKFATEKIRELRDFTITLSKMFKMCWIGH